jgi:protoporphyrinogen oxidase
VAQNGYVVLMEQPQIGIIGGGPGGLLTAYLLQKYANVPYHATILEASGRLGGKIITKTFTHAPVRYEAGAAELYDYSVVGEDPLRMLVRELGLDTTPMDGHKVMMHTAAPWTMPAQQAWEAFDRQARSLISPRDFYSSDWKEVDGDPLGQMRFHTLLAQLPHDEVQRYVRTLIHSDLATEPEATNAIYGLQNYLMNDPAYMRLYSIEGGIERLPQELAKRLYATVCLNEPATHIARQSDGRLQVTTAQRQHTFDYLVVALPNHLLPTLHWEGPILQTALERHHAHYDYPAHYLRVTVLFERPFWQGIINESYFMLDAFDGCCVYVESARNGIGGHGVLGWLLGGAAAERMSALADDALLTAVLDTLPPELQHGRALLIETNVQRWCNEVNGMPSGYPPQRLEIRHLPEPQHHPNLFVVGDYLFDSTLNGVLDSASFVADWLSTDLEQHTSLRTQGITR